MTKSDAIRNALRSATKPLTLAELQPRVEGKLRMMCGRQDLYTRLTMMQNAGEIKSSGRGDERRYALKQPKSTTKR